MTRKRSRSVKLRFGGYTKSLRGFVAFILFEFLSLLFPFVSPPLLTESAPFSYFSVPQSQYLLLTFLPSLLFFFPVGQKLFFT